MKWLAFFFASLMILASCGGDKYAEDAAFVSFDDAGWRYGDTLDFIPAFADSADATARIAVAVRHSNSYEYSNLWLEIQTTDARDSVHIDTVNVILADVFGKWYGRGTGVSYVCTDTLPSVYSLRAGEPVRLRHVMRVDSLLDIEQIGLIFINADGQAR